MTNINITRNLREKIHKYSEYDETVEDTINRLLDEVGDISEYYPFKDGSTSITLSDKMVNRIKSNAVKSNESVGKILERAFTKLD